MRLPTDAEINAKAEELGITSDQIPAQRAHLARLVLDERRAPAPKPAGQVLSRSVVAVADGHLVVEVTHYPEGTAP